MNIFRIFTVLSLAFLIGCGGGAPEPQNDTDRGSPLGEEQIPDIMQKHMDAADAEKETEDAETDESAEGEEASEEITNAENDETSEADDDVTAEKDDGKSDELAAEATDKETADNIKDVKDEKRPPGNSIADMKLIKETFPSAISAAYIKLKEEKGKEECDGVKIIDMSLASDVDAEKVKTEKPDKWNENWTMRMCSFDITVPVSFYLSARGTNHMISPSSITIKDVK